MRIQEYILRTKEVLLYSVEQSPPWEANRFLASQEIPRILWNLKVHYRIHKGPPPVPILSQIDSVHDQKYHFLKIHLNIFLQPMPEFSKWSLSPNRPWLRTLHFKNSCSRRTKENDEAIQASMYIIPAGIRSTNIQHTLEGIILHRDPRFGVLLLRTFFVKTPCRTFLLTVLQLCKAKIWMNTVKPQSGLAPVDSNSRMFWISFSCLHYWISARTCSICFIIIVLLIL
jgi:hypothetical protein